MVSAPSGLRSAPVARLAAEISAWASMNSLPLPLETTTGALDAAVEQNDVGTPSFQRVLRSALPLPLTLLLPESFHPLSSRENR
jgi:hypothetical protein